MHQPINAISARDRLIALNESRDEARVVAISRVVVFASDEVPGRRKQPTRGVTPNAGIEAAYRRRLDTMIGEMAGSTLYWIRAAYRKDPPRMAEDASPADVLQSVVSQLAKRWQKKFNTLSDELAVYFADSVEKRSSEQLKRILKDAGWTVPMTLTPAQRDVLDATVNQNVGLIRSIPEKYFTEIEGAVMRSVQTGRDLKQLTDDIEKQTGVTRRRAAFIARDQSNKATAAMSRAKQVEVGITEGVWKHSSAGKTYRPEHVKMNGKTFDLSEGMYDSVEGRYVLPGELINCRCGWVPKIPGFTY